MAKLRDALAEHKKKAAKQEAATYKAQKDLQDVQLDNRVSLMHSNM